jgi:hypothetical protein
MRERLAAPDAGEEEQRAALQKIAFEVAVGINRAAPRHEQGASFMAET